MANAEAGRSGRFNGLIRGDGTAAWDRPLWDETAWIVAPTLGAIVPGWLLAIPHRHVLNFRDWSRSGGHSAPLVIDRTLSHLGLRADEAIWFEHGASASGTSLGCGVDHAHLHILIRPPFAIETFEERVTAEAPLKWQMVDGADAWAALSSSGSYLIFGSANRTLMASEVEAAGSQFFRRVVASLADAAADWDYRRAPNAQNVQRTIDMVRALELKRFNG